MVCVLKEKELKIYIQEKDYGKNGIKKKIKQQKKWRRSYLSRLQRKSKDRLAGEKKQTETNEDKVDKRMKKKKLNVIRNQKINKKQQINEEYNEEKEQQNVST